MEGGSIGAFPEMILSGVLIAGNNEVYTLLWVAIVKYQVYNVFCSSPTSVVYALETTTYPE